MTIKELKALIQDLPDDTLLLSGGSDHSYIRAHVSKGTALAAYNDANYFYEDFGDEYKDNKKDKRITALIIS